MEEKKILLAGGGTGGHVLPLVEVARGIKKLEPEAQIYFVGPEEFSLNSLREERIIIKKIIAAGKIRRYFSLWNLVEPFKIPVAFIQSFFIILAINPDVVLGKGSYGSVWPMVAAWLLGKKIVLHESDAVPGLANRFLARFTHNIALAFENTKKFFPHKNIYAVGNPVRLKYLGLTKNEALKVLNIQCLTDHQIIFISGGSQGAQKINSVILEILNQLCEKYFVIWSVGQNNLSHVKHRVSNIDSGDVKLVGLLNEKELASAYILSSLAIGRAGSGTIFELAAFAKPSILIPLERKGGDQPLNAQIYADTGATVVLPEAELSPQLLLETINDILSNVSKLETMNRNAQKFAKIDAGAELAQILLDL